MIGKVEMIIKNPTPDLMEELKKNTLIDYSNELAKLLDEHLKEENMKNKTTNNE